MAVPAGRQPKSSAAALSYAVRPRVVAKYLGQLAVVLAILMVPPAVVALATGEVGRAGAWVIAALAVGGAGLVFARLSAPGELQPNEGMVVVALAFLLAPLVTSALFMPDGLSFVDAFFEAVSGITTTGLTTVRAFDDVPRTFLFGRAWMQWYGGLGFVVLSLALVIVPGAATMGLTAAENDPSDLVGGMHAHARRTVVVYAALTLVAVGAIWASGAEPFTALIYALAAISTGGFSPSQSSLAGLDSTAIQATILATCLAGAVPIALWDAVVRRRHRHELNVVQVWALLASTGIVMALLVLAMRLTGDLGWGAIARHAPALAASAQSTAGFSTIDMSGLGSASKGVLIFAMMIGGGAGSTAGGIKLVRVLIAIRLVQTLIVRTLLPPDAVLPPRLCGRRLDTIDVAHTLALILLFVGVVAVSWMAFLLFGHDPLNALFEVVSATGTVGLSTGITSSTLATPLKLVLCADMLLGRLEIVVWLVLLHPATWWSHRRRTP
jgi:trk system potassium uptake protein TrkH